MPKCLDQYSWRSLKGFGDMAPALFHVGDYKNSQLKDGTPVQFRLIGFQHDKAPGGLIVPMTWEMVDCMPYQYPWNKQNTNQGSWKESFIRHEMNDPNGSIFTLLPDELTELAVQVIKLTADTYDGSNTIIETEDRFWIKSEHETFGRNIFSAPGEGQWYEWYRQEGVPWHKQRNGRREYTMLRSPYSGYTNTFCIVNSYGNANNYNAFYSYGLAPAFCF